MPRVPEYDSLQVGANTLPGAQISPSPMPDVVGAQNQQFSNSLLRAGSEFGTLARNMAEEANALRVDDAINKAKEASLRLTYDKDAGFMNQRGIDALDRQSGKPLAEEYGETLKNEFSSIADTLGNDAQRRMFAMRSNDMLTSFTGQAMRHEADQFRDYALSVREGTVKNRMQEIGLNYNNPEVIDGAITSIKAATYDSARLLGKSAEWAEAQARKMTSDAHKLALQTALEKNDIGYADAYLKKYSKDMDADDLLRVQGLITKEVDTRIAIGTATAVVKSMAPRIAPNDADRAFNIVLGTESGNRQFGPDGKPLTSPKGAVGIAQVMPATAPEAAKLAGLQWDENKYRNDPAYNAALGRAYFTKQLQDFGGNLPQAFAAYNAGPGATQKAIKTAQEKGGDWLSYLPAETQAYVAKNTAAYEAGSGQPPKPTLQDVHETVRTMMGNASPQRMKLAIDEATRQYEDMAKAVKQREDEAVSTAMRGVIQNGGRYSDLPVSVRSAIPPKEVDNVLNFAARVAKGNDVTNPTVYQTLATNPAFLKSLSDDAFMRLRAELNESDFKHFASQRADLISGKANNGAEDLDMAAMNSILDTRLRTLEINPHPKPTDTAEAARIGAIRKTVADSLLGAQATAGKKFNDADIERHVDNLFAKSQDFRTTFLGINVGTSSERLLTMQTSDIPGDIRDRLKADFKAAGIDKPTDADILGAYWKLKLAKK